MSASSLISLPQRAFYEPSFSRASILFADAISEALIRGADNARPKWGDLAKEYPDEVAWLRTPDAYSRQDIFSLRLVREFASLWAESVGWSLHASYSDGIGVVLPEDVVRPIFESSTVSAIGFYFAGISDVCCARLGSNDHDSLYGLYVNVPIWIPLGVRSEFKAGFDRQIRMVI